MLATVKSGEAAARRNYRLQLVLERVTGKAQESDYLSPAMQQGIDREPDARLAYEAHTGQLVTEAGFAALDGVMAGVSVDGQMDDWGGLLELKSPNPPAHLDTLTTRTVPAQYMPQLTHGLWVTGAGWVDFASWNPDFPESLRLVIVRVPRDEALIAAYEAEARKFLADVETETARVQAMAEEVMA